MLTPLPDANWPAAISDMHSGFAGRLNVYRTMAHHPDLLGSWANFRNHVVVNTALGLERSEVVILRSGINLRSTYEWAHHVSRARKLGMSEERILSIGGPVAAMAEEDALLARAVDQLFAHHRLLPGTQAALAARVGVEGMLDLMATVAHYSLLGFILNSFDVPIDDDIAAETTPPAPIDPAFATDDLE